MSTTRERREARAERLRAWAEKREADAAAVYQAQEPYRGDVAFNTQPGRIPLRERMNRQLDRTWESQKKASGMRERAANIDAAADRSIYADDPDAVERLRERIARLEAERAMIRAYNASCRRGQRDTSLLDESHQAELVATVRAAPWQSKDGAFPGYVLVNLGSNIRRLGARLAAMEGCHEQ